MNDGTVVDYSSTADVRTSIMIDVRLTSSGVSGSKCESNPEIRAHQPEMDLGHREGGLSARPPLRFSADRNRQYFVVLRRRTTGKSQRPVMDYSLR